MFSGAALDTSWTVVGQVESPREDVLHRLGVKLGASSAILDAPKTEKVSLRKPFESPGRISEFCISVASRELSSWGFLGRLGALLGRRDLLEAVLELF